MKYKLKELADISSSKRIYYSEYTNKGIPFYRGKEIIEKSENKDISNELFISKERYEELKIKYGVPQKGDIIMTAVGTLGKCWLVDSTEFYFKDGNCLWFYNFNRKINNKYLYYYMCSNFFQNKIDNICIGSTQKALTIQQLKEVNINIPCIETQNKIVKILDNICHKIRINSQTNDNLYDMCNVIFHNYLDKYSEQVEYTKIVDIVDRVVTGKTPLTKNEEFWNGDIPFITIPDMHNQIFTIDTERTISGVGAKSIIPENSISVSCIATVGLVSISTKKSQTNQQINSIVLKNDYDLYYLFEFLSEQESFMKNIAGGSTTYNINKTTFENIEIPYLPQNIIQEFHNTVCKLFDKIKLNQLENKNLEQLRDTLLPKLMNGEIDLDKIEI